MSQLIPGKLLTTAMAILPHDHVEEALKLARTLDIPFWPQLPHVGYYEDMYVQAAEHFPGIVLMPEQNSIRFDTPNFMMNCRKCWTIGKSWPILTSPPPIRSYITASWRWI
ncbi:hypothetical protein [Desulfobacca acetoxidans]|uniref:hypothetical protein n=1 Tax=Desulfobacca acetoxidans TaxID=60893 RepID=UPI0002F246CE|nr:hypothetical protein [Desulfobacca acetoxidans]